jgi:hypothetical protein
MNVPEYIPPGRLVTLYMNIYYDASKPEGQRLRGGRMWHLRDSAKQAADLMNHLGILTIEVNTDDMR